MNMQDIVQLATLLNPEGEEEEVVSNPYKGSVFGPGDIGGKKEKEIAKPFAQVQVKGGRNQVTEIPQVQGDIKNKPQQQQNAKTSKNDIWSKEEVSSVPISQQETRIRPEVDVLYKQAVGTEDVFGGWSGIDPSSTKCQFILLRIHLPGSKLQEISLEIQNQVLVAQSVKYYLNYTLPYPVKEKEGKAKWISDKEILEITLPIIREEMF